MANWRYIPNYGNRYLVSDEGEVMSLNYDGSGQPKILGSCGEGSMFKKVHLVGPDGQRKRVAIHRLVAECFLRNESPETLKYVKHKSKDLTDNRAANLMWSSYA